jgi:hypothetical protein
LGLALAAFLLTSPFAFADTLGINPNPRFLKVTDHCSVKKSDASKPRILLVKQWHLSATVNTKAPNAPVPPQAANQTQIYSQLDEWAKTKAIHIVVAEGCEGKIDSKFTPTYNGWNFNDLKMASHAHHYEKIPSHAVLKLEAKYGDAIEAICGDDNRAIKEEQLAFSDARGDLGYLSQMIASKNDPAKAKLFREGAIEALKLKSSATDADVLDSLKKDLKDTIQKIKTANENRSAKAVETIAGLKSTQPVPVIFGGAHITQMKKMLEEKGFECDVLEPLSYSNDEEKLLDGLEQALKSI